MGSINFSVRRGETFDRTFTWWTVRDVTARDLTGYALRWQIRSGPGGTTYADLQIGTGITLVDADSGVFRVVIAAAVTAAALPASFDPTTLGTASGYSPLCLLT